MSVYLDYQSSKPVDPIVIKAMQPYFHDKFGNPSSLHKIGDDATQVLEENRQTIANFINAEKDEIIFTSGATESNNLALIGFALRNKEKGNHIITSKIEHHAVLNTCKYLEKQGFKITYIKVDKYGIVDIDELKDAITDKTILITIMHANNEIGTIEPVSEIAKIIKEVGQGFNLTNSKPEGLPYRYRKK